MITFVLIHGGMHGAWCWRPVRRLVAGAGHEALTPTLAGLGYRAATSGPEVDLELHVSEIVRFVDDEELDVFVLVGHSYAGMVITGVADRIGGRISHLVYLDALVPEDGESARDIVSPGVDYSMFADGMLPPAPDYDHGLTRPDDVAWVRRRVTPQSVNTLLQPLSIAHDLSQIPRFFIECAEERDGARQLAGIAVRAGRIAADPSWRHHVLHAGHDCMISHLHETAELLLSIAKELPASRT